MKPFVYSSLVHQDPKIAEGLGDAQTLTQSTPNPYNKNNEGFLSLSFKIISMNNFMPQQIKRQNFDSESITQNKHER